MCKQRTCMHAATYALLCNFFLRFGLRRKPFCFIGRSTYFCPQSALCGYSTLVFQDAWHQAKDQSSIQSIWARKHPKTAKICKSQTWCFSSVFGCFLWPGWSDSVPAFFSVLGILRYICQELNWIRTALKNHGNYAEGCGAKYLTIQIFNHLTI